jgi:uncharacterized membrane protein
LSANTSSTVHASLLPSLRAGRLDALRGLAIVWMVLFHFCFDLNFFGYFRPAFSFNHDALWTVQRSCIVSLFLLCAGLGQAMALQSGQGWPRFWRRWAQVAGCAVLVSAGSATMFPNSWISFGVLHGMAVMLVIARLVWPLGTRMLPLAALALVAPQVWASPWFDSRWGNWLGLVTHKPFTEDYVPVLPWLGVMLCGLFVGQWFLRHRPAVLCGDLPSACRPLVWLGRHPLTIYMVHQPLLIGALTALQWLQSRA